MEKKQRYDWLPWEAGLSIYHGDFIIISPTLISTKPSDFFLKFQKNPWISPLWQGFFWELRLAPVGGRRTRGPWGARGWLAEGIADLCFNIETVVSVVFQIQRRSKNPQSFLLALLSVTGERRSDRDRRCAGATAISWNVVATQDIIILLRLILDAPKIAGDGPPFFATRVHRSPCSLAVAFDSLTCNLSDS